MKVVLKSNAQWGEEFAYFDVVRAPTEEEKLAIKEMIREIEEEQELDCIDWYNEFYDILDSFDLVDKTVGTVAEFNVN